MVQLGRLYIQSLLKLLMMLIILSHGNAASPIRLPQIDGLFPISNLTGISASNATDLSATNNRRFIDVVKEVYSDITARYRHAYLIGVRAKLSDSGQLTSLRVIFSDVARTNDRGIVVTMGPGGQWNKPLIQDKDYGVGNKYMFRPALVLDVTDANKILKTKYPRAQYTAVFLYHPKQFHDFADQPYWIFTMKYSLLWNNYLWVGVYDWKVVASNDLPQSVIESGGAAYVTVS